MAQTGTIYGYHDGATYSLANVYDEKASELEKTADLTNVICAIYFDSDTGMINEKGGSHSFFSNSKKVTDTVSRVTTETAKFDYALPFEGKEYISLVGSVRSGVYIPQNLSAKIEGWFYVDTSAVSDTGAFLSYNLTESRSVNTSNSAIGSLGQLNIRYEYTKDGDNIVFKVNGRQIDFVENTPLYLVAITKPDEVGGIYVNGVYVAGFYRSALHIMNFFKIGCSLGLVTGNPAYFKVIAPFFKGSLSEFKITSPLIDENVLPPSSSFLKSSVVNVPANILIRHNDANHYIPLTTDAANTSAPYIAVRHGSTNYYAIK